MTAEPLAKPLTRAICVGMDDVPHLPLDQPPRSARAVLEGRWLGLTRKDLPGVARARGWPVHLDHCFQRILLDHACGGVWYDTIKRRPAYSHAPDAVLRKAVDTGEAALAGLVDMAQLNRASLRARGKARG